MKEKQVCGFVSPTVFVDTIGALRWDDVRNDELYRGENHDRTSKDLVICNTHSLPFDALKLK